MKKRLLSALLALCMMLTMMPTVAFAAEGEQSQPVPLAEGDVAYIERNPSVYCTDLDTAIQEAQDSETVVLLKDATTNGLNLSKNITIQGADGLAEKPTVTFTEYGIALWGKALTFKDCNIVMEGIGSTPDRNNGWTWMTICASKDARLTLDNVEMTMDAERVSNSPHAIYFCNNNVLNIVNGSKLTIKNYPQDALEWDGGNGGYNVKITDSTFVSDHNRSGFTGTFYATITNSDVDVINSTGNGSNGSHFVIDASKVDFVNNGSHGLSAGNLTIKNSSVVKGNDNGMYGITYTGTMDMDGTSVIEANGNAKNSSGGGLRAANSTTVSTVSSGAEVTITDNGHNGLENYGKFTFENGAKLTIKNNDERTTNGGGIFNGAAGNLILPEKAVITNNHAKQTGGGICNAGAVTIPASVDIYNNHSDQAGDDIYNRASATISFPVVGSDWVLDDCNDAIDGWYDDSEGTRWEAHTAPIHTDEFADFTNGLATVKGLTALKAAHEAKALDPDDPNVPETPVSKSKTATNLDEKYKSEVTLSLPAADEQLVSDVVFVLDKSTSAKVEDQLLAMLKDLNTQVAETNAKVKVGVVIFNKEANRVLELTELNAGKMDDIEAAIKKKISSGTNTHAGLLAGKAMLDADTEVAANRKYMVFVSDGITYMYNEKPTAIGLENGDKTNVFAGPDNWQTKYGNNNAPDEWDTWLTKIEALLANDSGYDYPYETEFGTGNKYIAYDDRANHAMSIDKALYLTNQVYQEMQAAGYNCYAMTASSNADHPWATSFMNYLANGKNVSFDNIQNDIYYLLDEGSRVEDYMGYVAGEDGYNFDFVDDASALSMKVGKQTYAAEPLGNNQYGFALNEQTGGYDYILTYDAGNKQDTEHFVWDINVPVSQFEPVQLTYTVKLTNPQNAIGTYGQYDKDGSENYSDLYTNNSATLYPVDSNGDKGIPEEFAKPTVSYTIGASDEISITPADITIYTGGEGYDSVVNGTGNEIGATNNGLPTPGFYINLPDDVNKWLLDNVSDEDKIQNAAGDYIVDLSKYLTFTYDDGQGTKREWTLERYDMSANGNNSMAYNQFIYRIKPAVVGNEEIPIRLQFTDSDGAFMTTDDFTVQLNELYHVYDMSIYPGDLNQELVKAVISIPEKDEISCDAVVKNGELTVRGVTDNGTHTTDVVNTAPTEEVSSVTAQVNAGTKFTINGSALEVQDPSNVKLLVDSLVTDTNNTLVNSAVNEFDVIPDDYDHETRYLDLVDTSNGNVYVTASDTVTVYWAYPEGTDKNTEFHLVHYEGLDRNNNDALENGTYNMELYSVEEGNLENTDQGIKIKVDSFSPFALFWEDDNGGSSGGGGNNKPDDLNTEDHFAYIIGYPKDYRTGEPTDDESLWPVEPQGNITRAEVATIFFRMLTDEARSENWSQTNSYTDVASTDWYNNAISTLSNMGIISGDPSGAFRPDDSITRAEFTKIAVGFFDKAGDYVDGTYDDVSSSDWYADFIDAAVDLGLIEGYPDGTIRPEATITRAEACTIVNRTLGRVPDKDHLLPADEMRVWPDNSDTDEWYYAQIQEATNSHDYEWIGEENDQIENWTEKLEDRDWAQLEREWSDANSAPGGEVVD